MFVFMLQAILLLAIAFILGSVAGCLLRTQLSEQPRRVHKPASAVAPVPAPVEKPAEPKPSEPAPAANKPAAGGDDLKRIKGIGRQIETKLNDAGITRYEQIAGWTQKDIDAFSEKLSFSGRVERDDWVGQAKKLAKSG